MFARAVERTTASSPSVLRHRLRPRPPRIKRPPIDSLSKKNIGFAPTPSQGFAIPPGGMQFTYDSARMCIWPMNSYHPSPSRIPPPPSSLSNNTMRGHPLVQHNAFSRIPCKKYHAGHMRAAAARACRNPSETIGFVRNSRSHVHKTYENI